ncbi:MAG: septation regulator SpoVG [Clostridia bacterium]
MNITDVRIKRILNASIFKAIVSITIDNCLVIHDIKIIEGKDGDFISMPSRKTKDGEFVDIVHPINPQTRQIIQDTILKAYNNIDCLEQ